LKVALLSEGMRRAGFLATLVAGVAFLGASLHGMTKVDTTLRVAAAPPPQPELVRDACDRPHEKRPRV
jgi:hypothetical protein